MVNRLVWGRSMVVVLVVVLALASGCGSSKGIEVESGEVRVDLSDNWGQVELEQGQTLVVALDANATTGYQWELAGIEESVLQQVGEGVYEMDDTEDPPPPGTGGVMTFRFKAVSAGQTALELVYRRSWEEGVDPIQVFELQVVVR